MIGAHLGATGGVSAAPKAALKHGFNAFAFFSRNQRRWKAKPLEDDEVERFLTACNDAGIDPRTGALPHGSYLSNLGNPDPEKHAKGLLLGVRGVPSIESKGNFVGDHGLPMLAGTYDPPPPHPISPRCCCPCSWR